MDILICAFINVEVVAICAEGTAVSRSIASVAIVKKEIADSFLAALKKDKNGKHAAIIGEVTNDQAGNVMLKSKIGGRRIVNFLAGEQLPRIC